MYALRIFSRNQLGILEVSPPGDEGWTLPYALWDHLADSISDPVSGPCLCLAIDAAVSTVPSFHQAVFVTFCAPRSILILGYSLGFLDYLSYSEFLVCIFSCCIKSTKISTYLCTIDRHKKKQSICILTTLPSLLKSI